MSDPQASTVKVRGCAGMQFSPLAYTRAAATNEYWDLEYPQDFDPYFSRVKSPYAQPNTYGREHIYEIHLSTSLSSAAMHCSLRMMSSIAIHSLPLQSETDLAE